MFRSKNTIIRPPLQKLYNKVHYSANYIVHNSTICTVLYLILKFPNGGLMMIFLDRNIESLLNKKSVVMFDGNIICFLSFLSLITKPIFDCFAT